MAHLPLVCLGLLLAFPLGGAPATPAPTIAAEPVAVLGDWLQLYHQGKLDLTGSKQRLRGRNATMRAKDFVSITSGLFPDQDPERWSHEAELEKLCEVVVALPTPAAAKALLEVAAVGLDQREYTPAMNPVLVRQIAEKHLGTLPGNGRQPVLDLANAAATAVPLRAAALRALGAFRDELYRPALEAGLADRQVGVRQAAAQGCARCELATVVPALADQLINEADAPARIAMIDALSAIAQKHGAAVAERDRRRAVSAVLATLGKLGWNVDLAALDYLRHMRSVDTVPVLIRLLADQAEAGRKKDPNRSALVPFRAHELLVSLTGAVFPASQPDQWQAWWEQVRDTFTLTEAKALPAKPADAAAARTGGSFFGVPVRGSRVLFVVDASGSMNEEWGKDEFKFDVARRELRGAVEKLAPDAAFNLVVFGNRAESWRDALAPASQANKDAFFKHLDNIVADGSTNVWAGLAMALKLQSIEHNQRYSSPVDEIFVLSDGAPTVGDIVRPEQILATLTETNKTSRVRINTVYIETPRAGRGRGRGGRPGGGGGGGQPPGGGQGGGQGGGGQGGGWRDGMSGAGLMKQIAERNGGLFHRPEPPKR